MVSYFYDGAPIKGKTMRPKDGRMPLGDLSGIIATGAKLCAAFLKIEDQKVREALADFATKLASISA
jgi:hypothetical protein